MKKIWIEIENHPYPVFIGRGVFENFPKIMSRFFPGRRGVVVSNRKIFNHFGPLLIRSLKRGGFSVNSLLIPDGERFKNEKTVTSLYSRLLRLKADRETLLFALGGGVVGDITGFVAATYLRGVPLIHIPTTLVSQVDSSIGGKTGINLPEGKNLVGSFYHPILVIIDPKLLLTLSTRDYIHGLAEVIKYGCIASPKLFQFLEENVVEILNRDPEVLEKLIVESIRIKGEIVREDPYEMNATIRSGKILPCRRDRRILNFGHTIGHGLESLCGYRSLSHGEAVSIGMSWESQISHRIGTCNFRTVDRIVNLLRDLGLPIEFSMRHPVIRNPHSALERLWKIMEVDKKVRGGKVHFVLPRRIGQVFITDKVDRKTFISVVRG